MGNYVTYDDRPGSTASGFGAGGGGGGDDQDKFNPPPFRECNEEEEEETSPFEKYNPLLHVGIGVVSSSGRAPKQKKEVLSLAFIKKYIQYAKNKPAPVLTKGAADHIVDVYATLRNEDLEGNRKRVPP